MEYCFAITSCGRFDLLRATLESFLEYADIMPVTAIIIEDSTLEGIHDYLPIMPFPVKVIVNQTNLGQMRSIDVMYEQIKTPYIFHCEDDWTFTRSGFIAESFAVLKSYPTVSMVSLRPREELNPLVRKSPTECCGDVSFFRMDPKAHPEYFSYSFNPGLRRLEDIKSLLPLTKLGYEEDVSYRFKKLGFQMACLEPAAVYHTGYGRHVNDPTTQERAKTILSKWRRSIRKRVKRLKRFFDEIG